MLTDQELSVQGMKEWAALLETHGDIGLTMAEIIRRWNEAKAHASPPIVEEPPDPVYPNPPTEDPWDAIESAPFREDGAYAYLRNPSITEVNEFEGWGPHSDVVDPNESSEPQPIERLGPRKIICNSVNTTWGEHGPKWFYRLYNSEGLIQDEEVWRVGDFHAGREGHYCYANVFRDLTLRRVIARQHGGQLLQAVNRQPQETKIPSEKWQTHLHTIRLEDVESHNGGCINHGAAVRAAHPIAIYNPGQAVIIEGLKVRCKVAPFRHRESDPAEGWASHGGLFVGHGQTARRTNGLVANRLDVEVWRPDRECVRIWDVAGDAIFNGPRLVVHGGQPRFAIVDDCDHVVIDKPVEDIVVRIHRRDNAWGPPYQTVDVVAGSTYEFERTKT